MFSRHTGWIIALALIATAVVSPASHASPPLTVSNTLTFPVTVALPGVTLRAGTYVFERYVTINANVVRVTTTNRKRLFFVGSTTPVQRPPGLKGAVEFDEARPGEALQITAWYPIGSDRGHQFIYR